MHAQPIAGLPVHRREPELHADHSNPHANYGHDTERSRKQPSGRLYGSWCGSRRGAAGLTVPDVPNAYIYVANLADVPDASNVADLADVANVHGDAHTH